MFCIFHFAEPKSVVLHYHFAECTYVLHLSICRSTAFNICWMYVLHLCRKQNLNFLQFSVTEYLTFCILKAESTCSTILYAECITFCRKKESISLLQNVSECVSWSIAISVYAMPFSLSASWKVLKRFDALGAVKHFTLLELRTVSDKIPGSKRSNTLISGNLPCSQYFTEIVVASFQTKHKKESCETQ